MRSLCTRIHIHWLDVATEKQLYSAVTDEIRRHIGKKWAAKVFRAVAVKRIAFALYDDCSELRIF